MPQIASQKDLVNKNNFLKNTILEYKNETENLSNQIQILKEQIEWFKRQIFGKKSEKITDIPKEQLYL